MASGPWFGLLGPLQVRLDDRLVPVRAGKHRALLAALLLRAGRVVPVGDLVAFLWGQAPPARTRGTLQTYVMRLRQLLGDPSLIRTTADGYRMVVPPERVDVHRFTTTAARASAAARAGDLGTAADLFAEALGLWRGQALADVPSSALRDDEVPRLAERLMIAHEERNDVELALGRHERLVPVLRGLTADHPLRERFWAQLMLALHRGSRQAEALEAFRRADHVLGEQLGVEPGDELRGLHQKILVGDPGLALPRRGRDPDVPRGLPPDVPGFVGRAAAVDRITRLIAPDGSRTAVPIVVVAGVAGVGKTALVTHVAHRLRDRFPDGLLYADLRGYTAGPPAETIDVLSRFLRALGVPPERIPGDVDECGSLFRSLLAQRRMLIVLDNAAAPDRVRPLLPGVAACPVLVTSRSDLRGLIAVDGARPVPLDVLTPAEAQTLLGRSGPAAAELARRCGHLPLTLGIAAASIGDEPVGHYLAALGDRTPARLAHERQSPATRRLFGLLGVVPGGDFDAQAAANLADVPVHEAAESLDRLAAVRLLVRHGDRYGFHDELARFARESEVADGAAARVRLLEYYAATVDRCAEVLYPDLVRLPAPERRHPRVPAVDTPAHARAWLDAELHNLTSAIRSAAEHGPAALSWRLADGLRGYLWIGRHVAEWLCSAHYGLVAAHDQRDRAGEAAMHRNLGTLHRRLGDFGTSISHYTRAVELHRLDGDRDAEAGVRAGLGLVRLEAGDLAAARDELEACLALQRETGGARSGEAGVLVGLGALAVETGEPAEAVVLLTEALSISTAHGLRVAGISARTLLGLALHLTGGNGDEHLAEALRSSVASGFTDAAARVLETTAYVRLRAGDHGAALSLADRALTELRDGADQRITTDVLTVMAAANRGLGALDLADAQYQQASTKARAIGYRAGLARALSGLAGLRRVQGELAESLMLADQAAALTAELGLCLPAELASPPLGHPETHTQAPPFG
ncbi:BTAD domain-containing putative transcriptional regulator [Saccharothrix violaceirubra]|uniref:DNA-binding SARP family transcriptional activator/Tfp pilus assembly protein PilF n=1 Tax=Saccharothrix violaceirubra TaxID=413306 RepID=A0A7W7T6Z5_9PSEU|nr:BTAD domain-containing putative transcriptional regulator [Saccharothrix violaceirubra]MBB4967724.1 DNA-binding SARP family transcriptional activator/Tfp pilus assembly protein PilF [Saccharothrix violaceirubra]